MLFDVQYLYRNFASTAKSAVQALIHNVQCHACVAARLRNLSKTERSRRVLQNSTVLAELDGSRRQNSTVLAELDCSRRQNSTVLAELDRFCHFITLLASTAPHSRTVHGCGGEQLVARSAERRAPRGTCDVSSEARYVDVRSRRAGNTRTSSLYSTRHFTGSQWGCFSAAVMLRRSPRLIRRTTLAAECWTNSRRWSKRSGIPYIIALP